MRVKSEQLNMWQCECGASNLAGRVRCPCGRMKPDSSNATKPKQSDKKPPLTQSCLKFKE